jgi:hypothetical protein
MRRELALTLAIVALGQLACERARASNESFTLEEHDQLIAEAPGCEADCHPSGKARVCELKDPACRAICRTLPECRPAGERAIQACATIRGRQ